MNDLFTIHSLSQDKLPGEGIEEYITVEYSDLAKYSNWRIKLSDKYICPFVIDGNTYDSVNDCPYPTQTARLSKFTQNEELYAILMATKNARLRIKERGMSEDYGLEEIRCIIKTSKG